MGKKTLILLSLFFVFTSLPHRCNGSEDSLLDGIPPSELTALNSLFQEWICFDPLAHTLHSDKPMTWLILRPGQKALWDKYSRLFQGPDFIFHSFEHPSNFYSNLLIVNREAFLGVVSQDLLFFQEKLGKDITPEELLGKLQYIKRSSLDVLNGSQELLGILFGFGKANAVAFGRKTSIISTTMFRNETVITDPPKALPPPSAGFTTLEEEISSLRENLTFFSLNNPAEEHAPYIVGRPYFAALKDHPETKQLREKYFSQRKRISSLYSRGNFLEVAMKTFIGDENDGQV